MIMDESISYHYSRSLDEQPNSCDQANMDESPGIRLLGIEALLAITASMIVFLGVFGLFRRRCGNRTLALVAFWAYNLSPAIIAYTLGVIQNAPFTSAYLPVWAAYLMVVLGSVDSYTAHSIEDIEQWKSFRLDYAAKCFMTVWMILTYANGRSWDAILALPVVPVLFVVLFMKADERTRALMFASNSVMEKKYKLVADYMSTEHQHSDLSHEDPATMRGYKYLVRLAEEAKVHSVCLLAIWRQEKSLWLDGKAPEYLQEIEGMDGVITVDKVWACPGRLLNGGDPDGRLKDLCLSFSLFKFICMRFAGYSLLRKAHDKLWHLIQHMLSEENGYERVFRVIEVELAFLFDLFYTKYPVNLNLRRSFCRLLLLLILAAAAPSYLSFVITVQKITQQIERRAVVTAFLMMSILVVELTQFGIMIFSEWAKVTYICKYVRNRWWQRNRCAGKLIEIMCRVRLVKPWGRQLRQYSLLKSYSYSPPKWIYNRLTAAYLDQNRNGQKQSTPTNLSKQVKKAIAQSLGKYFTSYLEKGQAFLRHNNLSSELSWACDLETTTHVIMVWHIATTFCEYEVPCAQLSQEQRENFGIATKLSQYLAYLVAFAPELLPGHPCRTEYIFSCAVSEAREKLGASSVSMEERIQKLKMGIDNEQCQDTIVARGTRLGMQLVNGVTGEGQIWKVLADFWADMMLYVAPSNNTVAHAKYLTTGGEFVTHIWVLVSHVGITRDPHGVE